MAQNSSTPLFARPNPRGSWPAGKYRGVSRARNKPTTNGVSTQDHQCHSSLVSAAHTAWARRARQNPRAAQGSEGRPASSSCRALQRFTGRDARLPYRSRLPQATFASLRSWSSTLKVFFLQSNSAIRARLLKPYPLSRESAPAAFRAPIPHAPTFSAASDNRPLYAPPTFAPGRDRLAAGESPDLDAALPDPPSRPDQTPGPPFPPAERQRISRVSHTSPRPARPTNPLPRFHS